MSRSITHRTLYYVATIAVMGVTLCSPGLGFAAKLKIVVTGVGSEKGRVGCALYSDSRGFPKDRTAAELRSAAARVDGVECDYSDLAPGTYAAAVYHDLNENGRTDRNFLGIPKEPWGTSNNVRPALRAPSFDEASFVLAEDAAETLTIEIAR